jgi:K+ transporter
MIISQGSVKLLVVLYSINVFITFVFSQLGMVRHWWASRLKVKNWYRKLAVNGVGLLLTGSVLIMMLIFKFFDGGWITLLITGLLIILAFTVRRHYYNTAKLLHRLNSLVIASESSEPAVRGPIAKLELDQGAKTAVLLVNGFNGIGLHTLFGVIRLFGSVFKNFVFIQVGVLDAGNFKGSTEVTRLESNIKEDLDRYVSFMNKQGYYAEGISVIGVDVVDEIQQIAPQILERFPNVVFFGGQLIFPDDSFVLRLLHNHTIFTLQKILYRQGIPFLILPIRV